MARWIYTPTTSSVGNIKMAPSAQIRINGQTHNLINLKNSIFTVKETDLISFTLEDPLISEKPTVWLEDYQTEIIESFENGYFKYQTPDANYFAECFGAANLRVVSGGELIVCIGFNVLAKKASADQAKKMIQELANHSADLIRSCFSRSALSVGSTGNGEAEPETLLCCAEQFLTLLESSQQELFQVLKKRLVSQRVPSWNVQNTGHGVDPTDILCNLDALMPNYGAGDVFIRGRFFDLGGIYVSTLVESANVLENQILIGGLYSIKSKIESLQQKLSEIGSVLPSCPDGYESLERLLLTLTADGMRHRCEKILHTANGFISILEKKIGITFNGELKPIMTPFVRSSKIYRRIFSILAEWYELGSPSVGPLIFMMKLKSLHKIYEMYCFYKILLLTIATGWEVVSAKPHPEFAEYLPSTVSLNKNGAELDISYEPKIGRFNSLTQHMDIIDVWHSGNGEYSNWCPDFLFKLNKNTKTRYLILDAKYSTASSLRNHRLEDLVKKYVLGLAVHNQRTGFSSSENIIGVVAIYPLDVATGYLSYWPYQGIHSSRPRLPAVGGIGLAPDNEQQFQASFQKLMEIMAI